MFIFSILFVSILTLSASSLECGISPNIEHYKEILSNSEIKNHQKILGGEESKNDDWPWLVFILITVDGRHGGCTGSLIHPQWVITATHCEIQSTDIVYYNDVNYNNSKTMELESTFPYSNNKAGEDITLLKLAQPLEINENVNIICLPTVDINNTIGVKDVIAGWGAINNTRTYLLHETFVSIKESNFCSYTNDDGEDFVINDELCAGGHKRGTTIGDSGGPLMQLFDDKWTLHGITSRGQYNESLESDQGIYTNVFTFCQWIKTTTNNEVSCIE